MPPINRICNKCSTSKDLDTEYYQNKNCKSGYMGHCKSCHKSYCVTNTRRHGKNDVRYRLYYSSKMNSRNKGMEHTISMEDIKLPKICKYLGVVLDYRSAVERGKLRAWNAPSIDRIDSTRGYVPGNIQIISDLANRMKQEATIDQLVAFAKGVLRVHDK